MTDKETPVAANKEHDEVLTKEGATLLERHMVKVKTTEEVAYEKVRQYRNKKEAERKREREK